MMAVGNDFSNPGLLNPALSDKLSAVNSDDQLQQLVKAIAEEMQSSSVTLLQIIESIQSNIVNAELSSRQNAINFLVLLLQETVPLFSPQEIQLLFTFFTNQLSESNLAPLLVQGLLILLERSQIHEHFILLLVKKIFADVNVQQFSQAVRHLFFRIFDLALTKHFEYVQKSLKNDLILGFISTMDGEKDPRNLMIVFRIIYFFATTFTLDDCAQDLFEVTFCYFPITFKPPPNDPYGITPQDLKSILAKCLSASPSFAHLALPSLLEKLESTNINAKRDTLTVLTMALPVYGPAPLILHVSSVWKALKTEIFHPADSSYEKLALHVLETTVRVLSLDQASNSVDLILNPGVHECLQHLQNPDTKLAKVAGLVFRAFIASDVDIANRLVPFVIPFLVTSLNTFQTPSQQKTYIDALSEVLQGCQSHIPFPESLRPMFSDVYTVFQQASQATSLSLMLSGYKGLFHLLSVQELATPEEQGILARCLTGLLLNPTMEVREKSMEYLSQLAAQQPSLIHRWVLPELFSKLTPEASWDPTILNTLVALTQSKELLTSILFSLINMIGTTPSDSLLSLLSTILSVLNSAETLPAAPLQSVISVASISNFTGDTLFSLYRVASELVRKLSSLEDEKLIVQLVFQEQLGDNPSTFPIFAGVIENVRPGVPLPLTESQFIEKALETPGLPILYVSKLIASIINKAEHPDTLLMHPSLSRRLGRIEPDSLLLSLWVTKVLLMLSHESGFRLCEEIFNCLASPEHGELRYKMASQLGILVSESKNDLNASSHSIFKPIHKQRTFQFCLSKITEKLHNATPDQRDVCILALRELIENISKQVLLASAENLAPLLLVALEHPTSDDAILLTSINTFESIALEAPDIAIPHVQTLVQLLLGLLDPKGRSMKIRIAALSCLSAITEFKYSVLHPLSPLVIRGLICSLDDPKRVVRRHAVNCRSRWYLAKSD